MDDTAAEIFAFVVMIGGALFLFWLVLVIVRSAFGIDSGRKDIERRLAAVEEELIRLRNPKNN